MNIQLLKFVDRWLGSALALLLPKPRVVSPTTQPGSILIIRPGGIGDAVHLIPAVHRLQTAFPACAIDILAERRNAGTFVLCPGIRRVLLYDSPGQLLNVLCHRYDVVIDTEQWHRLSAVITRLVRSSIKVGYATNVRRRLFTHVLTYSHADYEVDSFLHLLKPLGITAATTPDGPWLQVPAAARQAAAALLGEDDRPLVVLFPGASIVERRWGAERFGAVARWCEARGLRVVVVGGGGDCEEGAAIVAGMGAQNFAGCTSLAETAAILERAAVVVSGDSGILHIAVGLGSPTVSLFGPGIAAKWAPRGSWHVVLNRKLDCSPCTRFGTTPPCPHDVRCLKEINVAEVTAAITVFLATEDSSER